MAGYEVANDTVSSLFVTRQINVSSLTTHTFASDDPPKAYDLLGRERATAVGDIVLVAVLGSFPAAMDGKFLKFVRER
jgi:hypothetical protein